MAATYSTDNDIASKYSHLKISNDLTVGDYREEAYHEINMEISKLYIVPVVSTKDIDQEYLKSIESRLAAGNILIAVASVSEVENVHEYGKLLIDQAREKIDKLIDQTIILTGAPKDTDDTDELIDAGKIQGSAADEYSTFNRPMSGIENDAIKGKTDSEKYNSLEDNKRAV